MSEENSEPNSFKGKKSEIDWRRTIVLQRLAQGYTQSEIARELNLHRSTISQDYRHLNELSKRELRSFLHDKLPMEITQAFASYDNIIRTAWDTANNTRDEKTKIQALHLIKETRESRIDLVSNIDIATKVMDMATSRQKPKEEEEEQEKGSSELDEPLEEHEPL